jgi:hypothetical protein
MANAEWGGSSSLMFILMPTFDGSAHLAEISLGLLERYWPAHPTAHVLHHLRTPKRCVFENVQLHDRGSDGSRWVGNIRGFLESRSEELFLLMLDDYALSGPLKVNVITQAVQLMEEEPTVGLFPLCWYPAAHRIPRAGRPGIDTLTGTPVLLQAGIWRRSWFLQLSEGMADFTSPWSFEAMATQRAKRCPAEICAAQMPPPRQVSGHFIDGLDKTDWPLPYHNLMHRGEPALEHEAFLLREGFAFPARGLGDTMARMTQATGVATVVDRISRATGRDCGCGGRREVLNRVVPYRTLPNP